MSQRSNYIKSVIKALDILEVLDKEKELGISELSEKLNWDKSTVHRLVSTLKLKGYVVQSPTSPKYSNSFKLFEMGNNVVEKLGLRRQAQPFLEELLSKTHETVNLAIQDGPYIIYIDKIESPATIKVDLSIGKRLPIYCTGLGKAMLAFMPQETVTNLLKDQVFYPYTPKTVKSLSQLMEELTEIRRLGYSIDDEEYVADLKCIAAPIRNYHNQVVAAISIAVPKYRYDEGAENIGYVELVKTVCEKFSRELGCNDFI
ncbi:IclR family transcriptional regulator [Natronincola ferrireducens]|uniref:Transcriptional regulator, IclR family n=1 Tax=Natronincola ferrireducens TaxID=393762 RepID=A0A1G9FEM3_9FIRM|nr:IclR family transcriptional regulator [Natronincola ferrireducens]SDK86814.1 transcriptional regulator, IclR family [Natronincola ferrireducens]